MRLYKGGGSCFMNAALQALFAPDAVKGVLCDLWRNTPVQKRKTLLQGALEANTEPGNQDWEKNYNYETMVAVTFRVCFAEGLDKIPLFCNLLNPVFYKGEQEDSDEFLRTLLEGRVHVNRGSPTLVRAMSGTLRQYLKC